MTARSVPVLRSWIAGETDTGSYMQTNVNQAGNFLLSRPQVAAHNTVGLTMTTAATWYSVPLDIEDADDDGFHDSVTNNSRFTVPGGLPGWYHLMGKASCAPSVDGIAFIGHYAVNGTFPNTSWDAQQTGAATGIYVTVTIGDLVFLNAGDYVEMKVQCSAAGKVLGVGAGTQAYLKAIWSHA